MRRSRSLVLPLVIAVASTMAACGDDGNDSNTEDTPSLDTQPESSPALDEESETPTSDATAQSAAGRDPDIGTEEPSDTGAEGEDRNDGASGGDTDSGGDSGGG